MSAVESALDVLSRAATMVQGQCISLKFFATCANLRTIGRADVPRTCPLSRGTYPRISRDGSLKFVPSFTLILRRTVKERCISRSVWDGIDNKILSCHESSV